MAEKKNLLKKKKIFEKDVFEIDSQEMIKEKQLLFYSKDICHNMNYI